MFVLKQTKAISYSGLSIETNLKNPTAKVETREQAEEIVARGYHTIVEELEDDNVQGGNSGTGGNGNSAASQQTQAPLSEMTIPQLKEYAEANGIDITGLTKKDDILAAIEAAEQTDSFTGDGTSNE